MINADICTYQKFKNIMRQVGRKIFHWSLMATPCFPWCHWMSDSFSHFKNLHEDDYSDYRWIQGHFKEDSTSSTAICEVFWSVLWCELHIKSSHMFWRACEVIAVITKKTERQREGERDRPGAAIHSSHAAFSGIELCSGKATTFFLGSTVGHIEWWIFDCYLESLKYHIFRLQG